MSSSDLFGTNANIAGLNSKSGLETNPDGIFSPVNYALNDIPDGLDYNNYEEHLRLALRNGDNKHKVLSELINLYESEKRTDYELDSFYWDFIKTSFLQKDKSGCKKAIEYFSRQIKKKPDYKNILYGLPRDSFKTTALNAQYLAKEKNLIPLDFAFRYNHHDYKLLKTFRAKLGATVLHLGCNLGLNSVILARNGHFVYGVDIQTDAINGAIKIRANEPPEIAQRISYCNSTFADMQLPPKYFNSVIAFDVLEHIYEEDLPLVLDKISNALKPGGYLIIHCPFEKSFPDPAHVAFYNEDKIRNNFGSKFEIERLYITDEKDGAGNKRINLIAKNISADLQTPAITNDDLKSPEVFTSGFFNEYYTHERVKIIIEKLYAAIAAKLPFSMVRIGDIEARFLAYGKIDIERLDLQTEAAVLEKNLGLNPCALQTNVFTEAQKEYFDILLEADILGSHRKTVNAQWSADTDKTFAAYHQHNVYLQNEFDVVINAELLDQGYLLPLLSKGKILLIGNAAVKFARLLQNDDYRESFKSAGMPQSKPELAGAIYTPHSGAEAFGSLDKLWEEVQEYDFDIAIIAASITGKILAGRIKKHLGKIALDVGWSLQYLADASSPVAPARDKDYMSGRRGFSNLFDGRTK